MIVTQCERKRIVVFIAPVEWEKGCVRIKDMATGQESDVPLAELP